MTDYLPAQLRHLLSEGVEPLGRTDSLPEPLQWSCWSVKIRETGRQGGQWVENYRTREEAVRVAEALTAAMPGAVWAEWRGQQVGVTRGRAR